MSGQHTRSFADVKVNRLYQLAAEPPVKVVLEYALVLLASLPPELFGALVWDSLKGFVSKARARRQTSIIELHTYDTEDTRTVKAIIRTNPNLANRVYTRTQPGFKVNGVHRSSGRPNGGAIELKRALGL